MLSLKYSAVVLFLFGVFGAVQGKAGVDLSVQTTADNWNCLVKDHDISYAIIRAYRSLGALDENAADTLKLAHSAGIKDLGAYMFPCITTSSYSVSKNITCDSAEDQVTKTLDFLHENGIYVKGEKTDAKLPVAPVFINRMWIDIEDEVPSKYYDADTSVNQEFLAAMVAKLNELKVPVGIYTTKTYWTNILNNVEGYSSYPLWYPRYDATDSMDFFTPFAGWESCAIKQTGGDVGYCGITQVDSDYSV